MKHIYLLIFCPLLSYAAAHDDTMQELGAHLTLFHCSKAKLKSGEMRTFTSNIQNCLSAIAQSDSKEDSSALKEMLPCKNKHGDFTLLHAAAFFQRAKICKFFIKHNLNLDEKNKDGLTPWHCALEQSTELTEQIINGIKEKKINPSLQDNDGRTLLHLLIKKHKLKQETVHTIIETGNINPNMQDKQGNTFLHMATETSANYPIILTLLAAGACKHIRNANNHTPIEHYLFKMMNVSNDKNPSKESYQKCIEFNRALQFGCSIKKRGRDVPAQLIYWDCKCCQPFDPNAQNTSEENPEDFMQPQDEPPLDEKKKNEKICT